MGHVGPIPLATILSDQYHKSNSTEFQLTLETFSFDLSTFRSTSTLPNRTYNMRKSRK